MIRLLRAALLIGSVVCVGCANSRKHSEAFGVSVGDRISPIEAAVIYECHEWTSTASVWFSAPPASQCLKMPTDIWVTDRVIGRLPEGATLVVLRIKELNLVDAHGTLFFVEVEGSGERFLVNEFGAKRLFARTSR